MAFDNTKHDVELNGISYRIDGYQKTDFSPFLPRFSAGDTAESQFDLMKSKTLDGVEGGQLQRFWEDNKSVFSAQGLFPIYDDGVLYPVSALTAAVELYSSTKARVTAYLSTTTYLWIAYKKTTDNTNAMIRIKSDGTTQAITLPANLSSSSRTISCIVKAGLRLVLGVDDGLTLAYIATITTNSATEIGSGTSVSTLNQMIMFRGQLYGTDGLAGDASNAVLYRWTGSITARKKVQVGDIGARNYSPYAKILKYNNRIMLMRNDGMYAYDGVQLINIEDASDHINDKNYRHAQVHKGLLYYWMPDGLYRFNGSLIEKLYDVSESGYPVASCKGVNRIWYAFTNSAATGSSRYDKAAGFDYSAGSSVDARLVAFNGRGMFDYGRTATWTQSSPDFTGQGEIDQILWFNNNIYMFSNADKIGIAGANVNRYYTASTSELALSGSKSWAMITSIFDGDFAMIDKNLDNLELILDGNVAADQDITLQYRTSGFDGSTGWTSLGTIKSQSRLKEYLFRTIAAGGVTFKRIQLKLSGTTTAGYGIAKLIMRYTLSPDVKWQWSFTALCYGDDTSEPLMLADGTVDTQSVALLRGNIYDARMSDQPVSFVDIDRLDLNGALNDSAVTITLNNTRMLKDYGFVLIDSEYIYYAGRTSTTLTGCVRAMLGTVAAAHADNAKVYPAYRVLVRQIANEQVIIQDDGSNATEGKARPSRITVVLQEA